MADFESYNKAAATQQQNTILLTTDYTIDDITNDLHLLPWKPAINCFTIKSK